MMPGNLCTPEFLAATGTDIANRHGMTITVLGRKEMEAEGMGRCCVWRRARRRIPS